MGIIRALFLFCCLLPSAWGFESFVIEDIRVEGLQRISAGTVFNYIPIKVGDEFTQAQSADTIRALFKTGFFTDVRLSQQDHVLVITVQERPAIAAIKIEGNKDISSEDLLKGLKQTGLSEGKVFNRQTLDKVEQELRRQYFSRGKYGLKLRTEVTPLTRNRVAILIDISEGKIAKIKQINIVGNQSFDDKTLLKQFELSTTNLLSFYIKDDQYSKQRLSADLEKLRSYYLDRGYIHFDIESTQVAITPDKKEIYITINVKEGQVYTLHQVKLAGELVVPPEELIPLVAVGPDDVFSRKKATETSKAISDRLGEEGYIFANVNMVPDIKDDNQTVDITFFVDPGKRVYVRRINMHGNTKTRDEVLRREMRQMEASIASTTKIERSKTRLERLGYFEEVNVETPAVPGSNDQIDVNYNVVERPSGNLLAGFGFSQTQGFIINASVTQDNVFGSGKRVNFTFNNSDVSTIYRIGYFNPYFTLDGISSGFDLSYRKTDSDQANTSRFTTDSFNASLNFGIPLSEDDRLRMNLEFERTALNTIDSVIIPVLAPGPNLDQFPIILEGSSREIADFIDKNGDLFNTFSYSVGWSRDTRNRAIFPDAGGTQIVSALATFPGSDLEYYKLSYKQQHYFKLAKDLTLAFNGEFAYGDGYGKNNDIPFFEHFFAGGVQSIRGFDDNTLGPRDSRGDPFGGNIKLLGNAELLFPVPFFSDNKSVKMGVFFDAGNVYQDTISVKDLRYSFGLSGKWLSPFGGLSFSFAIPFNTGKTKYIDDFNNPAEQDDEVQQFQFSFGSGF